MCSSVKFHSFCMNVLPPFIANSFQLDSVGVKFIYNTRGYPSDQNRICDVILLNVTCYYYILKNTSARSLTRNCSIPILECLFIRSLFRSCVSPSEHVFKIYDTATKPNHTCFLFSYFLYNHFLYYI